MEAINWFSLIILDFQTNIRQMDRKKASYQEGTISIFVNICLFGLKYWAGVVSGSIALTADAWHTMSDSISSVVVIIGAKLASKKADKDPTPPGPRAANAASLRTRGCRP